MRNEAFSGRDRGAGEWALLAAIAAALALGLLGSAGCGGGGGGGSPSSVAGGGPGGGPGGGSQNPTTPPPAPDIDTPVVTLSAPPRGAYLDRTTTPTRFVEVVGTAVDLGSGVASVQVNGQPVVVGPTGAFRALVSLRDGGNAIVAEATDNAGNTGGSVRSVVFAERYDAGAAPLDHAIGARLNEGAMNAVGDVVMAGVVQSGAVPTMLYNGGQPIWRDNTTDPIFGGCLLSIQIKITNVQHGTPVLTFDCVNGSVEATVQVPNVRISAEADDWCGIPWWAITGDVIASRADFTLGLNLTVDPVTGHIDCSPKTSSVTLHGYNVDFTNLPGNIIGIFPVASAIRGPIETAIEDALRNEVPPRVEAELNALLAGSISRSFNGRTATLTPHPKAIAIDMDGLTFDCAAQIGATPAAGMPVVPGAFFVPTHGAALPLFAPITPELSLGVLSNAWNRAFHESWQGGFWNFRVDQNFLNAIGASFPFQLNANLVASYIPGLAGMLPPGVGSVPVAIDILPQCQPILITRPGQPDQARLQFPELHLRILFDLGQGYVPIFEFAAHAEADLRFHVRYGNELAFTFGGNPRFEAELIYSAVGLNNMNLTRFASSVGTGAIQTLGQSVAPLPLLSLSNQPLLLQNPDVTVDGPANEYLIIEGDL